MKITVLKYFIARALKSGSMTRQEIGSLNKPLIGRKEDFLTLIYRTVKFALSAVTCSYTMLMDSRV